MKESRKYRLRIAADRLEGVILFLLTACYIFTALGVLSLGLIVFPSAMLGRLGFLTVTSDISQTALLLLCGGTLLLGAGMSLCIIPICASLITKLKKIRKTASILGKKAAYEENKVS